MNSKLVAVFCALAGRALPILLCGVLDACTRRKASDSDPDRDPVVVVQSDDPEMAAAIRQARATLPEFVRHLRSPTPGQSLANLKVRLEEDGAVEHVWLDEVVIEGSSYRGRINNDVESLAHLSLGDLVTATEETISDWMVIEDGRLLGGYSIRLFRNRMTPAERVEFDQKMGVRFE